MDKNKSLHDYVAIYKGLLEKGEVQIAYMALLKYVMALKAHLAKKIGDAYSFGNVAPGYMDYTYFPFFDDFLRDRELRFGIVLNHRDMRFELWLMGRNAKVQAHYWELLQSAKWNEGRLVMPQYSVVETVLVARPDFNDLDRLTEEIAKAAMCAAKEIEAHISSIE